MNSLFPAIDMGAIFSADRVYRYTLRRVWDLNNPKRCLFIMLNPSTADEDKNDPTIRRCIAFAKAWGYGGLTVVNIFAFRATDPKVMRAAIDPIGIATNDFHIKNCALGANIVVCAWGAHGAFKDRSAAVKQLLTDNAIKPHYLKLNADGQPAHPLYLRGDLKPVEWK